MDLHAGSVTEHHADLILGQVPGAVAFDGERFERDAGGILAGSSVLRSQIIRDGERHLHSLSIALGQTVRILSKAITFVSTCTLSNDGKTLTRTTHIVFDRGAFDSKSSYDKRDTSSLRKLPFCAALLLVPLSPLLLLKLCSLGIHHARSILLDRGIDAAREYIAVSVFGYHSTKSNRQVTR